MSDYLYTPQTLVGPKVAVEKLSLEMFEGQITALLGHNGAGTYFAYIENSQQHSFLFCN